MTVWRAPAERLYFFPPAGWLGWFERCWFNDWLYAFGMAAILYVLYNLKELATGENGNSRDRWCEHQRRSRLMVGTGVVIVLLWAWLEEVADLVPGYVFDKWDLAAIYLGFAVGWLALHRLPYPVFGVRPALIPGQTCGGRTLLEVRLALCVSFVLVYTALVDPMTMGDRWSHLAELGCLILGASRLFAMAARSDPRSTRLDVLAQAP